MACPAAALADIAALITPIRPHPARLGATPHSASQSLADIKGQGSLPRAGQGPVSCQRKVGGSIPSRTTNSASANAELLIISAPRPANGPVA